MASSSKRGAREARDRAQVYAARQQVHQHQKRRLLRDNLIAVGGFAVIVAVAALAQFFYFTAGPGVPTPAPSSSTTPAPIPTGNVGAPDPAVSENRTWTGTLELNDVSLGIELDGKAAPQAVAGWIQDYEDAYYIGKTCHRLVVSDDFNLIQCGSLDGTGAGDPDFSYGPVENAPADNVYPAGTIAMARAGSNAYSNGHQFFITTKDTTIPSDAAGGYTVVGTVTSGLADLISEITSKGLTTGPTGDGTPKVATTITSLSLQ